jgi:hypothetical protein
MKATIKEVKAFYDSAWEDLLGGGYPDWICEFCTWLEEDVLAQPDETVITLNRSGLVYWQGPELNPTTILQYTPLAVFKKWRKRQTSATVSCTVPKEKEAELREFVVRLGGSC